MPFLHRCHPPVVRAIASFALVAALFADGCRAQVPPPGSSPRLSPELSRRVALTIRTKAALPFNYEVKVGDLKPSTIAGYDEVSVFLGEAGKPLHPMNFLLSKDGKTLAQMNTFDVGKDPRTLTTDAGRPARGGPEKSPVSIVVYDDLECPFCAKMHAQMFPAILNRYGNKVRIAYKDFPLTQIHPWATHAAVDADCLAEQNAPAYWNFVDYLHLHLDEIGLDTEIPASPGKEKQKSLPTAFKQIDSETLAEGAKQNVDKKRLSACVERQDETAVRASQKEGDALSVTGVPALFINGEMITGAVPIEFVYRAVDDALLAQGITPPPPVPLPSMDAAPGASQ
jgi:protein-disulfide isomerase